MVQSWAQHANQRQSKRNGDVNTCWRVLPSQKKKIDCLLQEP